MLFYTHTRLSLPHTPHTRAPPLTQNAHRAAFSASPAARAALRCGCAHMRFTCATTAYHTSARRIALLPLLLPLPIFCLRLVHLMRRCFPPAQRGARGITVLGKLTSPPALPQLRISFLPRAHRTHLFAHRLPLKLCAGARDWPILRALCIAGYAPARMGLYAHSSHAACAARAPRSAAALAATHCLLVPHLSLPFYCSSRVPLLQGRGRWRAARGASGLSCSSWATIAHTARTPTCPHLLPA